MMIRLISAFLATLSLWIFGPPQSTPSNTHIVEKIDVTAYINGEILRFTYTDQVKMGEILLYLRLLDPDLLHPMEPETFRTDAYEIRMTMLDGSETVYYQLYDFYLRKGSGCWYTISPTDGSMLHPLLISLPPDPL